jgi:hypothetical protein
MATGALGQMGKILILAFAVGLAVLFGMAAFIIQM